MLKNKWVWMLFGVSLALTTPVVAQASVSFPLVQSPYESDFLMAPRNAIQVYYEGLAQSSLEAKQSKETSKPAKKTQAKTTPGTSTGAHQTTTKNNKKPLKKPSVPTSYTVRGYSQDVNGNSISKTFTASSYAEAVKERNDWFVKTQELLRDRQILGSLWNLSTIQSYMEQNPTAQMNKQFYTFHQYQNVQPRIEVDVWTIGNINAYVTNGQDFASISTLTAYVQAHYAYNAQDWQTQLHDQGLE